jgi:transmembrane sensor
MSLVPSTMPKQHKAANIELQKAIKTAAQWHVKLNAQITCPHQQAKLQAQWQHWIQQSTHHQVAWQQIERLLGKFDQLPVNISAEILQKSELSRRELLTRLASISVAAPATWFAYRHLPWQEWQADHRTAVGKKQQISLPDGGGVVLNTLTAININYDKTQRLVNLHQGEIIITTAKDDNNRPFYVNTKHGSVQALGTRFLVRTDEDKTQVTVLEKSVLISPALAKNQTTEVRAKQHISFTENNSTAINDANQYIDSWLTGSLVAVDMPLGVLINELSRYRPGLLSCDEKVANYKVSGAFPLVNTELALDAITRSFPVTQRRFSRYWVKIVAQ